MRAAIPSVLLLLALTSTAHADFALPGTKSTDDSVVIQFGPEAEGYHIYLLCDGHLYKVERDPDHTVRFSAPYTHGTLPRLCAVPVGVATPAFDAKVAAIAGVVCSDGLPVYRGRDWLFNPRDGTEKVFQARITATTVEVKLVEERTEWSWPTLIVMGFLSLAVALGGIWLVRRFRRKSVTRTTPPPSS